MEQKSEIVRRVEGPFAMAGEIEARLQVNQLTASLLARAWTHSLPARSGCAFSLREMDSFIPTHSALRAFAPQGEANSFHRHPGGSSHLACSQRARIKGEL
jgi:hypothetical protein